MKPQGVDRNVITQRLLAMRRLLDHLDLLDQPGIDLLADYGLSFTSAAEAGLVDRELAAQLAESVGLRNVLVHAYLDLDLGVLARAASLAREQYAAYVMQVARWLRDQPVR